MLSHVLVVDGWHITRENTRLINNLTFAICSATGRETTRKRRRKKISRKDRSKVATAAAAADIDP